MPPVFPQPAAVSCSLLPDEVTDPLEEAEEAADVSSINPAGNTASAKDDELFGRFQFAVVIDPAAASRTSNPWAGSRPTWRASSQTGILQTRTENDAEEERTCTSCKRSFTTARGLRSHIGWHKADSSPPIGLGSKLEPMTISSNEESSDDSSVDVEMLQMAADSPTPIQSTVLTERKDEAGADVKVSSGPKRKGKTPARRSPLATATPKASGSRSLRSAGVTQFSELPRKKVMKRKVEDNTSNEAESAREDEPPRSAKQRRAETGRGQQPLRKKKGDSSVSPISVRSIMSPVAKLKQYKFEADSHGYLVLSPKPKPSNGIRKENSNGKRVNGGPSLAAPESSQNYDSKPPVPPFPHESKAAARRWVPSEDTSSNDGAVLPRGPTKRKRAKKQRTTRANPDKGKAKATEVITVTDTSIESPTTTYPFEMNGAESDESITIRPRKKRRGQVSEQYSRSPGMFKSLSRPTADSEGETFFSSRHERHHEETEDSRTPGGHETPVNGKKKRSKCPRELRIKRRRNHVDDGDSSDFGEDLEEDLEFLKSSPTQKRKLRGPPTSSSRKQKALEALRRRRRGEHGLPDESTPRQSRQRPLYDTSDSDFNTDGGSGESEGSEESNDQTRNQNLRELKRSLARENRNKDDEDFVVPDEPLPGGSSPHDLSDIPLQFSNRGYQRRSEDIKDIISWYIHKKLNPKYENLGHEVYRLAFRKLGDAVDGYLHSKFISPQWTPEFTYTLRARPLVEFEEIDPWEHEGVGCDACNNTSKPVTWALKFAGTPYHQTFEHLLQKVRTPNQDAQGQPIAPEDRRWFLGRNCKEKALSSHALAHWKWELAQLVHAELEDTYGLFSNLKKGYRACLNPEELAQYATEVITQVLESDFPRRALRAFEESMDEARDFQVESMFLLIGGLACAAERCVADLLIVLGVEVSTTVDCAGLFSACSSTTSHLPFTRSSESPPTNPPSKAAPNGIKELCRS